VEVTDIQKQKKIIILSTTCVSASTGNHAFMSTHENDREKVVIEGEAVIFFPELDTS